VNVKRQQSNKCKRLVGMLAGLWLAVPLLAHADGPALNAPMLGLTESILQYCGPVDPAVAAKLREKIKQLVQGASEQQLAQVRNSDEYRKAYASVVEFVGKVDEHDAKRICSESPAERK
jgi:hypothetical protein